MSDIKGLVAELRSIESFTPHVIIRDRARRAANALELMQEALRTLESLPAVEVNGGGVAAIARATLSSRPETKIEELKAKVAELQKTLDEIYEDGRDRDLCT